MKMIADLITNMDEEIEDAKTYAEKYLEYKAMGNGGWANKYREMSNDELKHTTYIHDKIVEDLGMLKQVYTPPEDMMEKWEKSHKKYVEKVAWIKQMLAM